MINPHDLQNYALWTKKLDSAGLEKKKIFSQNINILGTNRVFYNNNWSSEL